VYQLGTLYAKAYLSLSSCVYECGFTEMAISVSQLADFHLYQSLVEIIQNMDPSSLKKNSAKLTALKRAIKAQVSMLMALALYYHELLKFGMAHESLNLASYLVNNFILTSLDDYRKHVNSICQEMLPYVHPFRLPSVIGSANCTAGTRGNLLGSVSERYPDQLALQDSFGA
jgi:hypothetical protein